MENEIQFKPVVTKRASEIIYEQIASMITSGQLKAGDRLPSERSMIDMFGRSRPTIREALRMLERNGFIRINAGSNGAEILRAGNFNLQESLKTAVNTGNITLEELSEYRTISESAAVVWACRRRTDDDIRDMKKHLELTRSKMDNFEEFIELDFGFHELVAKAAGNSVSRLVNSALRSANGTYMRRKMETLSPSDLNQMIEKVQSHHEAIMKAIEAADEAAAEKAMQHHIEDFAADLQL